MTDDTSGDMSGDISSDGRWMTYDELAKLRGITRPSAERLVQRNHWRRQRGNDRVVRALVPMGDMSGDTSGDTSGDASELLAGALAALRDAVAVLREQLERSEAGRADERARADAERDKAEAAGQRAARAEHDRDQLLASHNRALLEVETLRQADRERRAAGRVARLRTAWRGE